MIPDELLAMRTAAGQAYGRALDTYALACAVLSFAAGSDIEATERGKQIVRLLHEVKRAADAAASFTEQSAGRVRLLVSEVDVDRRGRCVIGKPKAKRAKGGR